MKKIILSAAIAITSLYLGTAQAYSDTLFADEPSNDIAGMYFGAGAGSSTADCSFSDDECDSTGWKLYGGYKINDMLAVEGGYYNLGEYDDDIKHEVLGDINDVSVDATGLSVAGVAKYEVSNGIDVFGKLGLMKWEASADKSTEIGNVEFEDDGTDVLFGMGANYQMNDNLGIRGEYEHVGGDLGANLFTVGANYSTY